METLFMFFEWISLLVYNTIMEVLMYTLLFIAAIALLVAAAYRRKN
tara:strand:- start:438 stop:575 length:138 start_codon:yes stop_codon:yes gene_type:complete